MAGQPKNIGQLFKDYEEAVSEVAEIKASLEAAQSWLEHIRHQLQTAFDQVNQTDRPFSAGSITASAQVESKAAVIRQRKRLPREEVAKHVQEAVDAIKQSGKPLSAESLAAALNCDVIAARNRLQRGVAKGVLKRVRRGLYDVAA